MLCSWEPRPYLRPGGRDLPAAGLLLVMRGPAQSVLGLEKAVVLWLGLQLSVSFSEREAQVPGSYMGFLLQDAIGERKHGGSVRPAPHRTSLH